MQTSEYVKKYLEEMTQIRRHIHQHPELSNQEFETTKLIRKVLSDYGIEIAEIGLKTGVIGVIRGAKPGKTVGIREDIDALPIIENTGVPYESQVHGVSHMCGHDIHTSTLLLCAKALQDMREELCGNVLLIFQPAEETGFGAKQLLDCHFEKVLHPDILIGVHVSPLCQAGTIAVHKGPASASSDIFEITVTGKGGHGAHPENCVDPIIISAYLLTQLQTIVARENHPVHPAVLTIGSIHAGNAANVVPDSVVMKGTLRTLDPKTRQNMQDAIDRMVKCVPESMRGTGSIDWNKGMPPLINDPAVIDRVIEAASETIGEENIIETEFPSLGSEDFSYLFPAYAPGAQFQIGSANDDPNSKIGVHNAKNIFDDRCIETGATVLLQFTRNFLKA